MKKTVLNSLFISLVLAFSVLISPAFAEQKQAAPPLKSVAPEIMIKPEIGLGPILFGATIQEVEAVYGRGMINPEEPDSKGNTFVSLVYSDKKIAFRFTNGLLSLITIDSPDFATKSGVHVGGDIGDLIREIGAKYVMQKSFIHDDNPNVERYDLFFQDNGLSASVEGNVIYRLTITTFKKLKQRK